MVFAKFQITFDSGFSLYQKQGRGFFKRNENPATCLSHTRLCGYHPTGYGCNTKVAQCCCPIGKEI